MVLLVLQVRVVLNASPRCEAASLSPTQQRHAAAFQSCPFTSRASFPAKLDKIQEVWHLSLENSRKCHSCGARDGSGAEIVCDQLTVRLSLSTQVVILNTQDNAWYLTSQRNFRYLFYPEDYDFSEPSWQVQTVSESLQALHRCLSNFASVNAVQLDTYFHTEAQLNKEGTSSVPNVDLAVTSYKHVESLFDPEVTFKPELITRHYSVNASWMGPLSQALEEEGLTLEEALARSEAGEALPAVQSFFQSLYSMQVTLPLFAFGFGSLFRTCVKWVIEVQYSFSDRGQLEISMVTNVHSTCNRYPSTAARLADRLQWLNIVILVFACIHLLLLLRAVYRTYRIAVEFSSLQRRGVRSAPPTFCSRWCFCFARCCSQTKQPLQTPLMHATDGSPVGGSGATPALPVEGSRLHELAADPNIMRAISLLQHPNSHVTFDVSGGGALIHLDGNTVPMPPELLQNADEDSDSDADQDARHIRRVISSSRERATSDVGRLREPSGVDDTSLGRVLEGSPLQSPRLVPPRDDTSLATASGRASSWLKWNHGEPAGSINTIARGMSGRSVLDSGAEVLEGGEESTSSSSTDVAEALGLNWESIHWSHKLRLLNRWTIVSFAACVCNILAASLNLSGSVAHSPTTPFHSLMVALGCALLWIGLVRYLEHNVHYYSLVLTLRRGIPRVSRFLFGVLPVFMAFVMFSVVYFAAHAPRFGDVPTAAVTLFAVLNGDVVRDTFMDLIVFHPIVGQIFMYVFICLFIYVVLNVLIAVIEESFYSTAERNEQLLEKQKEIRSQPAAPLHELLTPRITSGGSDDSGGSGPECAAETPIPAEAGGLEREIRPLPSGAAAGFGHSDSIRRSISTPSPDRHSSKRRHARKQLLRQNAGQLLKQPVKSDLHSLALDPEDQLGRFFRGADLAEELQREPSRRRAPSQQRTND